MLKGRVDPIFDGVLGPHPFHFGKRLLGLVALFFLLPSAAQESGPRAPDVGAILRDVQRDQQRERIPAPSEDRVEREEAAPAPEIPADAPRVPIREIEFVGNTVSFPPSLDPEADLSRSVFPELPRFHLPVPMGAEEAHGALFPPLDRRGGSGSRSGRLGGWWGTSHSRGRRDWPGRGVGWKIELPQLPETPSGDDASTEAACTSHRRN